jgi:hypothetical protein
VTFCGERPLPRITWVVAKRLGCDARFADGVGERRGPWNMSGVTWQGDDLLARPKVEWSVHTVTPATIIQRQEQRRCGSLESTVGRCRTRGQGGAYRRAR